MLDFGNITNIKKISNTKYIYSTELHGDIKAVGKFINNMPIEAILDFKNNYWVGYWNNGWFVRGCKNTTNTDIVKQIGEFKNGILTRGLRISDTIFTISEEGVFKNNQLVRGIKKTFFLNLVEEGEFADGFLTKGLRKIETEYGNQYCETGIFHKNKLIAEIQNFEFKPIFYFTNLNLIHVKFFGNINIDIYSRGNSLYKLYKKNKYYVGFIFNKKTNILEAGLFKLKDNIYVLKKGYKNLY